MTLQELMDRVKELFDILYYDDDDKIQTLLRNSITTYQDKAGGIRKKINFQDDTNVCDLPNDLLTKITCKDNVGRFHVATIGTDTITVTERSDSERPYLFEYFVDVETWTMDSIIPNDCIGLITEHLYLQIKIRNTKRERDMEATLGQTPELPSEDSLKEDLKEIENQMADTHGFVSPIMVWG